MGPTAAGKTDLALHLADHLPCELISVDSALVYRGMDIGTAKPDAETLLRYPHHLVDILDPAAAYSAARFRLDAQRLIADILARGRIPVLVGGTMLYYKALAGGLAQMPAADPQVRQRIENMALEQGWAAVHAELGKVARRRPSVSTRMIPNASSVPMRCFCSVACRSPSGIAVRRWKMRKAARPPGPLCPILRTTWPLPPRSDIFSINALPSDFHR